MAFNPAPEVAYARDFAKKFGYGRVVILFDNAGTMGVVSYGETTALCAAAKRIGEGLWPEFAKALLREDVELQ